MTVTAPGNFTETVYDDSWLRAISSASGQTDLRYVVELFDAQNNAKLFEGKVVPEPSNKYMYFNVAPIIRNNFFEEYWSENGISTAHVFDFSDAKYFNPNQRAQFYYRIGTDYSGITTLNEASGSVILTNVRPKLKNRRWSRKSISQDVDNKWQTDRKPVSILSNNSDNFFIAWRYQIDDFLPSGNLLLGYEEYDAGGNLLNTNENTFPNTIVGETGQESRNCIINIGPDSIDRLIGNSPDLNVCAYYVAYIKYEIGATEYRLDFRINKNCENKYESIPIHFYNRFGVVDTLQFNLVSRTTMDVERKSYNQRDYRFSSSSVLYTDSSASGTTVFRENKINYNATYNYTMKLTSDFLDDQDWEWLEDLILSPRIYMEEDGYMYPVTIKATNYEISKYINNRLRPLEIEIEFNSPRLSSSR